MPMERRTDLRVQKTRTAIKDAFKQLVMEFDASQITVKELTDRAMIHRKTFYLHYTTIEALYEDILKEFSEEYYKKNRSTSAGRALYGSQPRIFHLYGRARALYGKNHLHIQLP